MAREILTAYDVVEASADWLHMGNSASDLRRIKRAMNAALVEVTQAVMSPYMLRKGRLHFSAPQTTGTIQYTHSTRLLTLTGATWPSDVVDYSVLVGTLICDIESRITDTVVRLDASLNPGEDVDAETTYTLFQRYYRLPDDFVETDEFWSETSAFLGLQVPLSQILGLNRYYAGTGTPRCWAIGGIQDQVGSRGIFIYPPAAEAQTQDYLYRRRPRPIRHTGFAAGDCVGTVTVSDDSTTVTGSSTTFSDTMEGSIFRVRNDATVPSGTAGKDPYQDERLIHTVSSATSLTLDRVPTVDGSGKGYVVTDPIDIDPLLYDLFLTRVYLELGTQLDEAVMSTIVASYNQKLHTARCIANAGGQPQSPLQPRIYSGTHLIISSSEAE